MIDITQVAKIQLLPGERIVAAVQHRGYFVVVTDTGTIYRVDTDV